MKTKKQIDFSYKLKRILLEENINLKEFSELAGISYKTALRYKAGSGSPTIRTLEKITNRPRFSRYRNLLLSLNEPANEDIFPLNGTEYKVNNKKSYYLPNESDDPKTQELIELLNRLRDLGREDEAIRILEAILPQDEKEP